MAIYTPRGLKIRYGVREAFLYLSRIYPQVHPFRVLQDAEAYEIFPAFCGVIAAIVCIVTKQSAMMLFCAVTGARLIAALIHYCDFMCLVPMSLLLPVLRVYGIMSGHGIIAIPILIVAFFVGGWLFSVAYLASIVFGYGLELTMDNAFSSYSRKVGRPRTGSELSFDQAFEYYCRRTGAPRDDLSDEERCSENWLEPLRELAESWPVVVSRFDFSNDSELFDRLNEVL